jgi:hypothetical protein
LRLRRERRFAPERELDGRLARREVLVAILLVLEHDLDVGKRVEILARRERGDLRLSALDFELRRAAA